MTASILLCTTQNCRPVMPPWPTVLWGIEATLLLTLMHRGNNDLCGVRAGTPVEGFMEDLGKVWKAAWNSARVSDKDESRK